MVHVVCEINLSRKCHCRERLKLFKCSLDRDLKAHVSLVLFRARITVRSGCRRPGYLLLCNLIIILGLMWDADSQEKRRAAGIPSVSCTAYTHPYEVRLCASAMDGRGSGEFLPTASSCRQLLAAEGVTPWCFRATALLVACGPLQCHSGLQHVTRSFRVVEPTCPFANCGSTGFKLPHTSDKRNIPALSSTKGQNIHSSPYADSQSLVAHIVCIS